MIYNKLILLFFFIISGCSFIPNETSIIRIVGSDTMLDLTTNLAEQFMKEYPGISVIVSGGGTATGIKALIKNETDICTASRNLKPEEAKTLAEYYRTLGLVFLIAKDALSVYVNSKNPVKDLSKQQLKNIFNGKIKNWQSIGGRNTLVIPVIRNPNSGTYLYFKEHILEGEDYALDAVVEPTTRAIINIVEENENAIGYGGMGYKGNFTDAKINGVEPSEENVRNDSYPIIRYLHFFTAKTPNGIVKKFIDWVLSPAGQSVVGKSGFISLWENKL